MQLGQLRLVLGPRPHRLIPKLVAGEPHVAQLLHELGLRLQALRMHLDVEVRLRARRQGKGGLG